MVTFQDYHGVYRNLRLTLGSSSSGEIHLFQSFDRTTKIFQRRFLRSRRMFPRGEIPFAFAQFAPSHHQQRQLRRTAVGFQSRRSGSSDEKQSKKRRNFATAKNVLSFAAVQRPRSSRKAFRPTRPCSQNRYRLRLLTAYVDLPEPRGDPLVSAFYARAAAIISSRTKTKFSAVENRNEETKEKRREISSFRFRVRVANDLQLTGRSFHLASLQFVTSNAEAFFRLSVFDQNEEILGVEGKGTIVLPACAFLSRREKFVSANAFVPPVVETEFGTKTRRADDSTQQHGREPRQTSEPVEQREEISTGQPNGKHDDGRRRKSSIDR